MKARMSAAKVRRPKNRREAMRRDRLGMRFLKLGARYFSFSSSTTMTSIGFLAAVTSGVGGVGRRRGEPVGFAGLPVMGLDGTGGVDDVHGAAGEGDDDSGMIVVVHRE